jgi:hypothetical protein
MSTLSISTRKVLTILELGLNVHLVSLLIKHLHKKQDYQERLQEVQQTYLNCGPIKLQLCTCYCHIITWLMSYVISQWRTLPQVYILS